ncbi:hypothetical protein J6590_100371 [Homalodisca vitripennis]|nr:hypothetical protein J6590_100371 [Homalodisca vitripennis]
MLHVRGRGKACRQQQLRRRDRARRAQQAEAAMTRPLMLRPHSLDRKGGEGKWRQYESSPKGLAERL